MSRRADELLALRALVSTVHSLLNGTSDLAAVREAVFLCDALQRPLRRPKGSRSVGGLGGVSSDFDPALPGTSITGEISKSTPPENGKIESASKGRSWLGEFGDAWRDRFGQASRPVWGAFAVVFAPLVREHGREEVLRRWRNYLRGAGAQYASAARFAATFGVWTTDDPDAWKRDPTRERPGESPEAYIQRVTSGNGR